LFHLGYLAAQVGLCFKMNNSCFSRTLLGAEKKLRGTVSEKNRRREGSTVVVAF
jgi:hypothetical protein